MRLVHDGSDVGDNLPLRAKLAELNIRVPEFDDERPLEYYFSEVESTIAGREGWRVHRHEICLGSLGSLIFPGKSQNWWLASHTHQSSTPVTPISSVEALSAGSDSGCGVHFAGLSAM